MFAEKILHKITPHKLKDQHTPEEEEHPMPQIPLPPKGQRRYIDYVKNSQRNPHPENGSTESRPADN